MSDWENVPENIEEYEGFVYLITNLHNSKKYVGKCLFWRVVKLPPLKGRTKKEQERRKKLKGNKRHKRVETKWRDYYGSGGSAWQEVVSSVGEDNLRREILGCYKTKWEVKYHELREQVEREVLFREDYYNGIIDVKLAKCPKELLYRGKPIIEWL